MIKDWKYVKIDSVNPLYLIFSNVNGYFEEKIKKYTEPWSKVRDLIRSITKKADDYDEKYMKITFNSDDELPLNKTIKISGMVTFARAKYW